MTETEARDAVKQRMGIPSATTSFDDMIDDFVAAGVRRLYPRAGYEVASQEVTSFTVDDLGECIVDLSGLTTPVQTARAVESYDNYAWSKVSDTYHHGQSLRLRGLTGSETKLRIYGLKPFPAIADVYDWLTQSVIWWSMSEFYDHLAGNKKSYNIYMQVSGSRAVDNMADQSAYYDSKADRYVDEQGKAHGG